jgi:hypothetical protein
MCVASYGAKWLKLSNLNWTIKGPRSKGILSVKIQNLGKNNESMEDYLRKGEMLVNFGYNIYQIN